MIANTSMITYSPRAKNLCRTGWRSGVWSWASVIESTNAEMAEEPAHSEITNPSDTTSPRAPLTMSRTVGAMISFTTLREKNRPAVLINCS